MATSVFPAMYIRPEQQQQPNILGQLGQMMALRQQTQMNPLQLQSEQLQVQQQRMQVDSNTALMQAYSQSGGDPAETIRLAKGSGKVLPGQLMQFQQQMMAMQSAAMNLSKEQRDLEDTQGQHLHEVFDTVAAADPDNQPALYAAAKQRIVNDPDAANYYGIKDPSQIPDYQGPQQLKLYEAMLKGKEKMLAESKIAAETEEARQKAAATRLGLPEIEVKSAEALDHRAAYLGWQQEIDPKTGIAINAGKPITDFENQIAFQKKQAEEAAAFPYQRALASARAQVQWDMFNQKDAMTRIEGNIFKPYQDQMATLQQFQNALDLAGKGNYFAARDLLMKSVGIAQPLGTKRYSESEAKQIMSQGNVPQQLYSHLLNWFTGDRFTPAMRSDMQQYAQQEHQRITDWANQGIDQENTWHSTKVPHLPMTPLTPTAVPGAGGAAPTKTRPPNATGTAPGPGGLHWVNKNTGEDLGLAQ